MVLIFTDTTSILSAEFVSIFSAEKLALALVRIGQDTGVEFSQAQKSFSIIGDWSKVTQAHASLQECFEKEQRAKENEQKHEKEASYLSQNQNVLSNEGRRGRKPGCTVAKSAYNVVPEPYVQYHNDQGLPVAVKSQKRERINSKIIDDVDKTGKKSLNESGTSDVENHYDYQDNGKNDKDLPVIKPEQECSIINTDNEYITVKEELDENAVYSCMDDDTDVDEQYLDNSDVEKVNPTSSKELDPEVKVKVEKITSDDERIDNSKSRRKSKPQKYVPQVPLQEEDKAIKKNTTTQKAKKSKGRPRLKENQTDVGKKKRKKKKKMAKIEDENTEFKCDKCEYIGKKKENLREHTQRMHRNKFSCETCKKQFGLHKDLLRHTRHVHTNPAYHCKICDKFYKFSRAYKEHMLSHEENYVKPQFECEICHKVFSTKYVLTAHVKSEHLGMKKSFMCPTCGRSFTQKNSYLMHANVHAGIKPYVCDVCGKAFSYDKSLKEHKYMHDDERRFSCDICAKTFRQKTSLLMHMKVHKDARDYICTSCGKGFTQKQALLRHERIHSGDKPFKCALCSRSFNDYSIIRRHMMMHHKRDKDPKTWRGDIICSLKRKTEFYIEGGPGYNGGDRLPTVESEADASLKAVADSAVDIPDKHLEDAEEADLAVRNVNSLGKLSDNSAAISQQNSESYVPSNTDSPTNLPDCSGVDRPYHSQGMSETSDAINKMQDSDPTASPSLPINYSMPTNYQSNVQNVPVTSVPSTDNDEIQRQYNDMIDSYRMQGQHRDIFIQNLSSMAPLPGLPQSHQLPPVSGEATHGQPRPNPWGIPGYPPYYSPANFSHYQGPQS
ncbi:zinc finger protein 652-like [Mercenaria mercenaria]|uniref:zinc finger protein 652-like n=1 Tax=Mercenaria mercenaria TaxID=6596 RepID=UPI00234F0769|nr:zinc finger protein 652-like [Mercenaria mercenaria]